ncbi:MAG: hypothetical protein QOE92_781 [Chloroflexota bacterium]|nr:hypothetical protein [Chloroflexota bacterium]
MHLQQELRGRQHRIVHSYLASLKPLQKRDDLIDDGHLSVEIC